MQVSSRPTGTCGLPSSTTPEFSKHDCGNLQAVGDYRWDIGGSLQLKIFQHLLG